MYDKTGKLLKKELIFIFSPKSLYMVWGFRISKAQCNSNTEHTDI